MNAAITAFFEMIKQFLNVKQTDMENKPILEMVKDKKSLKKGTDIAERILDITDRYQEHFSKSDLRRYNSLKKKFKKFN